VRWFQLPSQLARSGYVVVVPQLQNLGHPSGSPGTKQKLADTLQWMRQGWEHHATLMPDPATGLAGHSFGALHAGILAANLQVAAVASLSGGWLDWPGDPGTSPIFLGALPRLFTWGTDPSFPEPYAQLPDDLWRRIALPKHRAVFTGGQHMDYLYAPQLPCRDVKGPCQRVGEATSDLVTMFFAKYLPPELVPDLPDRIPDDLVPELPLQLTPEQQFFGGSHLIGMELFEGDAQCQVAIIPEPRHLVDRSAEFGTRAAGGAPTACVVPGSYTICYRDDQNRLRELWRDAHGLTGTTNLTDNAQAPEVSGNPFAYVDTARNTVILLFRGGDGTVRSLYWSTGPVGNDNLGDTAGAPKAAGDPVGYYAAVTDTHHIVYRSSDGHLHELDCVGLDTIAYGGNLTAAISAPKAAGQPSAFAGSGGVNIVAYRGVNNHILGLYWLDGPSGLDDLSGFAGTPPAAGDPFAYYTAHDDTTQIVYVGADGHVWELYSPGVAAVVGWDLTAPSGAPRPAGALAAWYSAGTNTKHVVYRTGNGQLHEIWWTPGGGTPAWVNLTAAYGLPSAADAPAGFTVEGPNTQHVAYRGAHNHIYEVLW
jgi:hypothetical protein